METVTLAGRAGRWAAAHWKTAFFGWLAFAAVAVVIGNGVGAKKQTDADAATRGSAKAEQILGQANFKSPADESVLVQSKTLTVADPAFEAAIGDVVSRLAALANVQNIRSPLDPMHRGQIAPDRRSALVQFSVRGDHDEAADKIEPMLDAVAAAQKAHPRFVVSEFGMASAMNELNDTVAKDFRRAEATTVPATLLILLIAFGALVAAGIPVLLAFSGVLATIGLSSLASHVVPSTSDTNSVILLIGMAVGVDYSLFYLRRVHEERKKGLSAHEALLRTANTSGQAVLVSGLTVMIAMAGMFFSGSKIFTSFAVATMLMVAVALIGSLTVLPALVAKLGDRVDKGRVPFLGRRLKRDGESRVWAFVLDRVLRRPMLSAGAAAAVLVALTVPAFSLHTQLPSLTDLPKGLGIVQTYDRIQTAFPGASQPAEVVVRAEDVTAPAVQRGIAELKQAALATGQMSNPIETRVSPDRTVAVVSIPLAGDGVGKQSERALDTLRGDVIPQTVGNVGGTEVAVTGTTAGTTDFNATMASHMPLVFAFVLGLVFVLLLLTFRSIVVPIKAVLLNLLSVGAAYGVLVAVFQHRWAEGILGFTSNGAVVSWLPMFLFVILFGLSMDYHVFILSRVKELVDGGMRTDEAVATGIKRTASVVTSAALVMIAVFAIFATLSVLQMKQMGVGLAVAILIDATLIRAVLLPATMKLLGDWNWYLPRWLEWLPRLSHEGAPGEKAPDAAALPAAN